MNKNIILGIIIVLLIVVGGFIFWDDIFRERPDLNDNELTLVEEELNKLSREITVRGRTVVLDSEAVEPESREEYAQLPYEISIGNEQTQLIEAEFELEPGETPVEFVERILEQQIPPQDELDAYSEEMFQYYASFYSLDEDILIDYPASDHEDAEPAEEGLSAYIRAMNFPDDSVGGSESRYDFIVSEDGSWILVWIGERTFCRRPGQEFWQPADQLCP